MAKRIILNADDFGPCESLNQGIYKAIDKGLISSVSVFVTFGEENLQNIIDLKHYIDSNNLNVGVGLHFTISAGKPVNKNPDETLSFRTSGVFAEIDDFKWRVNLEEFENEMKSQINLLAELLGGKEFIDHINCHVGICTMKDEFWQILVKQNFPVRSPDKFHKYHKKVRTGKSPIAKIVFDRLLDRSTFSNNILQKIRYVMLNDGKKVRNKRFDYAVYKGIKIPNLTVFRYYKQPSIQILENVVWQLAGSSNVNKVIEIMFHLSINDEPDDFEDYNGIDPKSFEGRKKELDVLLKSDLLNYMEEHEVELISYSQI